LQLDQRAALVLDGSDVAEVGVRGAQATNTSYASSSSAKARLSGLVRYSAPTTRRGVSIIAAEPSNWTVRSAWRSPPKPSSPSWLALVQRSVPPTISDCASSTLVAAT
jgi:hypothetical protein